MRESDVSKARYVRYRGFKRSSFHNGRDFWSRRLTTESRNFIWQLLPYKIIGDHTPLGSYRKKCHRRENPIEMSLILLPLARSVSVALVALEHVRPAKCIYHPAKPRLEGKERKSTSQGHFYQKVIRALEHGAPTTTSSSGRVTIIYIPSSI